MLNKHIQGFKAKKNILIFAFRHSAKEDAPLLLVGIRNTHLRFLYGRDVLNWAGKVTSFIFPRLGFIAVQNRGTNKEGLSFLKNEVQKGKFPLALAPEGQVTYHMYRCSPIQIGVANIALWALETGKEVSIVPLAVGYRYDESLTDLIKSWQEKTRVQLCQDSCKNQILSAYEQSLEIVASSFQLETNKDLSFIERRDVLCDAILAQAEDLAGLQNREGTILDRLFRLRFIAEDVLFGSTERQENLVHKTREYLKNCQVVDILEYLDPSYLEGPDQEGRMYESVLNLLDLQNRLEGGTINSRYSPRIKQAVIYAGDAVVLSDQTASLTSRKQKIGNITKLVEEALEKTSKELSTISF
ncbi:MAG: hypothetical protein EOM15_14665 [Spirochaetia bacterium]|nr:hypothetical protein [Spirochaetia bacterium]